jgi:hypothetical protein
MICIGRAGNDAAPFGWAFAGATALSPHSAAATRRPRRAGASARWDWVELGLERLEVCMGVGDDGDGSGKQAEDNLCSVTVPAVQEAV